MKTKVLALAIFAIIAMTVVSNFIAALSGSGWVVFDFENGNAIALVLAFMAGGILAMPFVENRSPAAMKLMAAPFLAVLFGVLLVWLWNGHLIAEYNSVYDFFTNLESARIRANHNFEALWDASLALQQIVLTCIGWLLGIAFWLADRIDPEYA